MIGVRSTKKNTKKQQSDGVRKQFSRHNPSGDMLLVEARGSRVARGMGRCMPSFIRLRVIRWASSGQLQCCTGIAQAVANREIATYCGSAGIDPALSMVHDEYHWLRRHSTVC